MKHCEYCTAYPEDWQLTHAINVQEGVIRILQEGYNSLGFQDTVTIDIRNVLYNMCTSAQMVLKDLIYCSMSNAPANNIMAQQEHAIERSRVNNNEH